jgi:hypothetical protein
MPAVFKGYEFVGGLEELRELKESERLLEELMKESNTDH